MTETPDHSVSDDDDPGASPERASSQPDFWDVRYAREEHLFGTRSNTFVAEMAGRLPHGAAVVELGAGEGRTLIHLAKTRGCHGTAVDFSATALQQAEALAADRSVSLDTVQADVRTWQPTAQWDAVIVTFLQLLPAERPRLYRLMQQIVCPGGWLLAEWFRPDHLRGDYARVGPSAADRMVPVAEVRRHFRACTIDRCAARDVTLREGPLLRGPAAVVRLAARVPEGPVG